MNHRARTIYELLVTIGAVGVVGCATPTSATVVESPLEPAEERHEEIEDPLVEKIPEPRGSSPPGEAMGASFRGRRPPR